MSVEEKKTNSISMQLSRVGGFTNKRTGKTYNFESHPATVTVTSVYPIDIVAGDLLFADDDRMWTVEKVIPNEDF